MFHLLRVNFANDCDNWCVCSLCFLLVSILLLKIPRCRMNGCLSDHFQYALHVLLKQYCCKWNKSWFWAYQIKANATIYCHGYSNSLIHTYCISTDSQPFQRCIIAYGRFWSASPAAEENKFIFRTIFQRLAKTIMNMSFLFFIAPKHAKMPVSTSRTAQRGSLCIQFKQQGCEAEVECLIIPHLAQCHCHFTTAGMNCLHLFSKVILMSNTQ